MLRSIGLLGLSLGLAAAAAEWIQNDTLVLGNTMLTGELTFYGAGDNCPPGGEIA
jgi:hypothetical protein